MYMLITWMAIILVIWSEINRQQLTMQLGLKRDLEHNFPLAPLLLLHLLAHRLSQCCPSSSWFLRSHMWHQHQCLWQQQHHRRIYHVGRQFSAWRISWGWWWGVDESKWWMTMGPQGFGRNPCRLWTSKGKNNPGLQCVKMRNVEVSILTSWRAVCVRLTSRCFWVGIVMTAE